MVLLSALQTHPHAATILFRAKKSWVAFGKAMVAKEKKCAQTCTVPSHQIPGIKKNNNGHN